MMLKDVAAVKVRNTISAEPQAEAAMVDLPATKEQHRTTIIIELELACLQPPLVDK